MITINIILENSYSEMQFQHYNLQEPSNPLIPLKIPPERSVFYNQNNFYNLSFRKINLIFIVDRKLVLK